MHKMKAHYNIKVSGKVQGVWYRDSARRKAEELGITGYARNEQDGSVFIEAEGDEDALDEFIAWCNEGPEWARVDSVDVEEDELKELTGFQIKNAGRFQ